MRGTILALLLLLWLPSAAMAQDAEADRRLCARPTERNPDNRIAVCTRVLAQQDASATVRAMALRSRAIAYGNKKILDLALADFDAALKLSPGDVAAMAGRAHTLYLAGRLDEAMLALNEVLRINPRSDRLLNERGLIYLRKGEPAAALAEFDAALAVNRNNVPARNNRALVLARQNKLDEAIAAYTEAIGIEPNYLLAYLNRARAYQVKGEAGLALADLTRASEEPTDAAREDSDNARARAAARQELARLRTAIAAGKVGPKAPGERRVALVVGNSAYRSVPALRNPVNDAKAIAAALRALGFAEVREAYDTTLVDLGKTLKDFGDLAAGADWAVIYYAGHGIAVEGVNYVVPVDAQLEQQSHVEDETLPLSRLLGKVEGASKMQLVILDACRNNPFLTKMRQGGRQVRAVSRGLALIEPDTGTLVAYSARDGTNALDGDGANSPYATALLRHLGEPNLEIGILFRKVRDDVLEATARKQEPFTYGSPPAQAFYFKR